MIESHGTPEQHTSGFDNLIHSTPFGSERLERNVRPTSVNMLAQFGWQQTMSLCVLPESIHAPIILTFSSACHAKPFQALLSRTHAPLSRH